MLADLESKAPVPAVIVFGSEVFDGATIKLKGSSSLQKPKKKYEVELPPGYEIGKPWFDEPIDRFDLQADIESATPVDEKPAWDTFEHFGVPTLQSTFVRVHMDQGSGVSKFHGTYLMREEYDGDWRRRNGYDNGYFFKHGSVPKGLGGGVRNGDEGSDEHNEAVAAATDFIDQVTSLSGTELEAYLLDHLDVPAYINFMAVAAVVDYEHWGWDFNVNQYRDSRNGRWQYLPLDLDSAYEWYAWKGADSRAQFATSVEPTLDPDQIYGDETADTRILEKRAFTLPLFRDMYLTRVATVDRELREQNLAEDLYKQIHESGLDSFREDFQAWLPEAILYQQRQADLVGETELGYRLPDEAAFRLAMMSEPRRALELFGQSQADRRRVFDEFVLSGSCQRRLLSTARSR